MSEVPMISEKRADAPVTEEHRELAEDVLEFSVSGYTFEGRDKAAQLLANYSARVEARARLAEAKLWDGIPVPHATLDHEYHVGFNPRCGACRRERIAELESAARECKAALGEKP